MQIVQNLCVFLLLFSGILFNSFQCLSNKALDLEYIPGDYTPYKEQHPSRRFLLENKYRRDHNLREPELTLSKLYLGDAMTDKETQSTPPLRVPPCLIRPGVDLAEMKAIPPKLTSPLNLMPQTAALVDYCVSPQIPKHLDEVHPPIPQQRRARPLLDGEIIDNNRKLNANGDQCIDDSTNPITLQAFANFELARKMHQNNLDHQPLPDCVPDAAYRKLEMTKQFPGLALDVKPIASGIGIKKYKAGPHHCTKMNVYRPKTANVKPYRPTGDENIRNLKPMDLAICWDYVPAKEPPPPKHIDGSSESGGPAVFTCVQSSPSKQSDVAKSSSNPVFNNTSGEVGFFEKDVLRKKLDFAGKKIDGIDNRSRNLELNATISSSHLNPLSKNNTQTDHRPDFHFNYDDDHLQRHHRHYDNKDANGIHLECPVRRCGKQYQSSPDIFQDNELNELRRKYLGERCAFPSTVAKPIASCQCHTTSRNGTSFGKGTALLRRARARHCSKVSPGSFATDCRHHNQHDSGYYCPRLQRVDQHAATSAVRPAAFRIGRPHYSASGTLISRPENGGCCFCPVQPQKVIVVPRPRPPYKKRSYNIDTLVAPFKCYGGGAKEGGYPEHWRLASVYQHAYKPVAQRKCPLIQTVYK